MHTPDVNWSHLVTLMELVKAGSLEAAAARLHVTASAVSKQMRLLEDEWGTRLFERIGRRSVPTPLARLLAEDMETHLRPAVDSLLAIITDQDGPRGTIRIGGPMPFSKHWLIPRLAPLLSGSRILSVDVVFGSGPELAAKLRAGELELAVLSRVGEEHGLVFKPVMTEEFVAVGTRKLLGDRGWPRTVEEFRAYRWITFDVEEFPHLLWWRMMFGPRAEGPKDVAARVRSLEEMLALAEAGVGLCVLPTYLTDPVVKRGSLVELVKRDASMMRRVRNVITLAWRKDTNETPAFKTVRDALLVGNR